MSSARSSECASQPVFQSADYAKPAVTRLLSTSDLPLSQPPLTCLGSTKLIPTIVSHQPLASASWDTVSIAVHNRFRIPQQLAQKCVLKWLWQPSSLVGGLPIHSLDLGTQHSSRYQSVVERISKHFLDLILSYIFVIVSTRSLTLTTCLRVGGRNSCAVDKSSYCGSFVLSRGLVGKNPSPLPNTKFLVPTHSGGDTTDFHKCASD